MQGTCNLSIKVKVDAAGTYTNTIPAGDLNGYEYIKVQDTLNVTSSFLGVSKSFSRDYIYQGDTTNIILNFTNRSKTEDITNLSLKDDLSTMGVDTLDNIPFFKVHGAYTSTCSGGSIVANIGESMIYITGLGIPKDSTCTVTIPIKSDTDTYPTNSINSQYRYNKIPVGDISYTTTNAQTPIIYPFELNTRLGLGNAIYIRTYFTPDTVAPLGEARLQIRIQKNSYDMYPIKDLYLINNLPTGHIVSNNPDIVNECGGQIITEPGSGTIVLTGGILLHTNSSSANCNIYVNIRVPALDPGFVKQTVNNGVLPDIHSNSVNFSARDYNGGQIENYSNFPGSITRQAISITANKEFLPTSINGGGVSRVRITLENTLTEAINMSGVGITDELPQDIDLHTNIDPTFTDQNGTYTGKCTGGSFSGVAGGDAISLLGANIAAGGICHFEFNVTSKVGGNHINTISSGSVISREGVTNSNDTASTLTVARNLNVGKGFIPNIISTGQISKLRLEIFNSNLLGTDIYGSSPALIDNLPTGIEIVGTPTTTCSQATVSKGINPDTTHYLQIDGGEYKAESSCYVEVDVTGNTKGIYTNTIQRGDLKTTSSGLTNADDAEAKLTIIEPLIFTKSFLPSSINLNGPVTLQFTLRNPNDSTLNPTGITGVKFSDILTNMKLSTPMNVSSTCANFSYSGVSGGERIDIRNLTVNPNSTCTVSIRVTSQIIGTHPNQSTEIYTNQYGTGRKSNIANLTVIPPAKPTITKSFSKSTLSLGEESTINFRIYNPNNSTTLPNGLTNLSFSDTLSGMVLTDPLSVTGSNCGTSWTYNGTPGGTLFEILNASIAPLTNCDIYTNVKAVQVGTLPNQTSETSYMHQYDTNTQTGARSNLVNLTVNKPLAPTIEKSFQDTTIVRGKTTQMIFKLTNNNTGTTLTDVNFTDTLSGILLTNPENITNTNCGTGFNYALSNSGKLLEFSQITILPKEICEIKVDVTSLDIGTHDNETSEILYKNEYTNEQGTGTKSNQANLQVIKLGEPIIEKSFLGETIKQTIERGDITKMIFRITNTSQETSMTKTSFSDTLSGITLTTPINITNTNCGPNLAYTYNNEILNFTEITINPEETCTIEIDVTSEIVGIHPNQTSEIYSQETMTGTSSNITNLEVLPLKAPLIQKSFTPNQILENQTSKIKFRIENPNLKQENNPISSVDSLKILTQVNFIDTLSGIILTNPINITENNCGLDFSYQIEEINGQQELKFSGITINPEEVCSIEVEITGNQVGIYPNETSEVFSKESNSGTKSNIANLEVLNPIVGLSKQVLNGPTKNSDGTYTVTYELIGKNYGDTKLENIQIIDDLTQLGLIVKETKLTGIGINPNYDGIQNTNLLFTGGVDLEEDQEIKILLETKLQVTSKSGTYLNQAKIEAVALEQKLMDFSQNGTSADPDGDLDPTNNNEVTPIVIEIQEEEIPTPPTPPITPPVNPPVNPPVYPTGGGSIDNCPNGDKSGSFIDGICEAKEESMPILPPKETIPETKTGETLPKPDLPPQIKEESPSEPTLPTQTGEKNNSPFTKPIPPLGIDEGREELDLKEELELNSAKEETKNTTNLNTKENKEELINTNRDFTTYKNIIPKTGNLPLSLYRKYGEESLIKGIDGNDVNYESLLGLYKEELMGNGGLNNIDPERKITRAELSKILVLLMKKQEDKEERINKKEKQNEKEGTNENQNEDTNQNENENTNTNLELKRYKDVEEGIWYEKYVEELVNKKIMNPVREEEFEPNGTVKLEELTKILQRMYEIEIENGKELEELKNLNIIQKDKEKEEELTRGELSWIIYRVMQTNLKLKEKYEDEIQIKIEKLDISLKPTRTLLEHPSVWLKDLSESGGGYYEDKERGRTIIFGHSSIWREDKNIHGASFKKLIGGSLKTGDMVELGKGYTTNGYEIINVVRVREEEIDKLKTEVPDGTKVIIFTCDKDINYRRIYYAG